MRPKAEIVDEPPVEEDSVEEESFSQDEIVQTTRLARDHAFGYFESGRAANASYTDTRFFELQTFMWMVRCGTVQGAARFQYRRSEDYGPHGDTHLRAVKQFASEGLVDGFNETTDCLLSVIASKASFRRPVTAAIDMTTVPYYGDVQEMPMVSGTKTVRDGRSSLRPSRSSGRTSRSSSQLSRCERARRGMRTRRTRFIVLYGDSFDARKNTSPSRRSSATASSTQYRCSKPSRLST